MKKNLIFIVVLLFSFTAGYSQIKVNSSGNVGIKTSNPVSHFAIGDSGLSYSKAFVHSQNSNIRMGLYVRQVPNSENHNYGIYGVVSNDANSWKMYGVHASSLRTASTNGVYTYGVKGMAGRGENGYNYGVMGKIEGSRNGTGICGCSSDYEEPYITGVYAGYFRGDVWVTNKLSADVVEERSDINVKKEIEFLRGQSNISKIKQLNGIKYKLKHPSELQAYINFHSDTANFGPVDAPKYTRQRIGLIAQDVQKVFPELVDTDPYGYLTLNYISLIPVLVEAMKEQQTEIEILQNLVEEQELEIIKIKEHIGLLPPPETKKSAEEETDPETGETPVLYQNNPNPFNKTTEITIYLPENVSKALLYVHDLHGAEIEVFDIRERGQVKTEIHANTLNKGMYLYSLVVDGKQVDSKRMILTD